MGPSALYDPHSPALQASLLETYRVMRDEHPVYHNPERGIWVLTRFDDVLDGLNDADNLASSGVEEAIALLPMMVYIDEPRHKKLRALLARAFTPRRVADLEPRIRSATRALLDACSREGRCDFMRQFATQLPSIVICELIGVPEERRATFLQWTESLIETHPTGHPIEEASRAIYAEFTVLLAERRADPADDLISDLLAAEVDGESLSEEELLGTCFNLIVGGTDTTTNMIGNGVVRLAQHPEQRELLAHDAARIPRAVEEILRYDSPTQSLPRRPTRDLELHGQIVPAGCRLLLTFGSANHDEREFDDPARFDVGRDIKRHLAFGMGIHHCMGAALARLEGRVAFEELLERHPRYELERDPGWVTSRWARARPQVPLRFPGA